MFSIPVLCHRHSNKKEKKRMKKVMITENGKKSFFNLSRSIGSTLIVPVSFPMLMMLESLETKKKKKWKIFA
jgi:hypothetical protein